MTDTNITHRIKGLMEANDITAYKVCKDCSISDGHFAEVLKYYPKRNFTIEQLSKLAKYFGVTTDWLIWGAEKSKDKDIQKLRSEILRLEKLNGQTMDALLLFNEIVDLVEKYKVLKKEIIESSTIKGYEPGFTKKMYQALGMILENTKGLKNSRK